MQDRSATTTGFTVRLEGASLFDLIQFECMDQERKSLRVSAHGKSGMLFFRDGNLVHAVAQDLTGEQAVRAMLAWEHGQVAHVAAAWPPVESISASWQSVLLHAATAADEISRVDNVVSFPARTAGATEGGEVMPSEPPRDSDPIHVVRVTASGEVVGRAADRDAAEVFAYLAELADVVGDALAIDRMVSIELWSSESTGVVVRDAATNDLDAAWGPRDVDVARLRGRLSAGAA